MWYHMIALINKKYKKTQYNGNCFNPMMDFINLQNALFGFKLNTK